LAIGAGGALDREGPSVQMGAVVARLIGLLFRRTWPDLRRLIAAGAGSRIGAASLPWCSSSPTRARGQRARRVYFSMRQPK
jgi:hypothetical protein